MQKTRLQSTQLVEPKQTQALCKNMTKLCVGSILYGRGLLDKSCFKSKPFVDGMIADQLDCVEISNEIGEENDAPKAKVGTTDEETNSLQEGAFLQQWIEHGVFDAIERQFLKSMSLIVAKGEADQNELEANVLENYTFKYEYSEDGECLITVGEDDSVPCTKSQMLEQAKQLIRNLSMFKESLPGLPEERNIVIKLKYHQNTPEDYEPMYFKGSSADAFSRFAGSTKPKKVSLGGISTPHHSLKLTFTAANWLFEEEEDFNSSSNNGDEGPTVSADMTDANAVLNGVEDLEEPVTQPEENKQTKPPASTPVLQQRGLRQVNPGQKSHASFHPKFHQEIMSDDDQFQQKFSRLSSMDNKNEEDIEEFEVADLDDDDITQIDDDDDDDDDVTRLDEEEDIEDGDEIDTTPREFPNPEQEASVLKHIRGKHSVSVSNISALSGIPEYDVTSILETLQAQDIVTKISKYRFRWTGCFEEPSSNQSVKGQLQSKIGQAHHTGSLSKPKDKKNHISKPSSYIPSPSMTTRSRSSKKQRSKDSASFEQAAMNSPSVVRKRSAAENCWNSQLDSGLSNELERSCTLSQDSLLSQGRSKYSISERLLHQNKKKRVGSGNRNLHPK